jgi:hypothetical protein
MTYPNAIQPLMTELAAAPSSAVTDLANRLIVTAQAYDDFRIEEVLRRPEYPGGIRKDFSNAIEFTADHVMGAPWADDPATPLKPGESWNTGRRASLTGQIYPLDSNGRPVNPYLKTGIRGRGVIGLYGPNHAVDVGVLTIKPDEAGAPRLYAYGIMKGKRPAFCGGFAEYEYKQTEGFSTGRSAWVLAQAKEFFEEMLSGSIELDPDFESRLESEYGQEIDSRLAKRDGKLLPEHQLTEIKAQIRTRLKLAQIMQNDPDFFARLHALFESGIECYAGPVRSSNRNTDTSWMETYLSWVFVDDAIWAHIRGNHPRYNYQLAAGDDADEVVAHKLSPTLLEDATGTHSAMFLFMAASFLLESQKIGRSIPDIILRQMEELIAYVFQVTNKPTRDVGIDAMTAAP